MNHAINIPIKNRISEVFTETELPAIYREAHEFALTVDATRDQIKIKRNGLVLKIYRYCVSCVTQPHKWTVYYGIHAYKPVC